MQFYIPDELAETNDPFPIADEGLQVVYMLKRVPSSWRRERLLSDINGNHVARIQLKLVSAAPTVTIELSNGQSAHVVSKPGGGLFTTVLDLVINGTAACEVRTRWLPPAPITFTTAGATLATLRRDRTRKGHVLDYADRQWSLYLLCAALAFDPGAPRRSE